MKERVEKIGELTREGFGVVMGGGGGEGGVGGRCLETKNHSPYSEMS